jgi:hypothetical protein
MLFSGVMRKLHYKVSFPQLNVMAIHKLLCLLDGIEIAGTADDFRWARNVVVSIDRCDMRARWLLATGGSVSVLSVTDALAQSRAGDASYVGCSTQRIQVERRREGDQ